MRKVWGCVLLLFALVGMLLRGLIVACLLLVVGCYALLTDG